MITIIVLTVLSDKTECSLMITEMMSIFFLKQTVLLLCNGV